MCDDAAAIKRLLAFYDSSVDARSASMADVSSIAMPPKTKPSLKFAQWLKAEGTEFMAQAKVQPGLVLFASVLLCFWFLLYGSAMISSERPPHSVFCHELSFSGVRYVHAWETVHCAGPARVVVAPFSCVCLCVNTPSFSSDAHKVHQGRSERRPSTPVPQCH